MRVDNKVWLVGVSDAESNSVICLCATKELAVKILFKERDSLVAEWKEQLENYPNGCSQDMYGGMIHALSKDDYENWDNYPHERPYITEMEVLDK